MRFLLYAFLLSVLFSSSVHAQNSELSYLQTDPSVLIKRQYDNRLVYKRLAKQARNYDRRNEFPFDQMVYAYAGSPDYDPYGKETIDTLYKLAYDVENIKDPEGLKKKYLQFTNIVNDHLGNLGIVNAAISLTRQNAILTDIDFLQWIKNGLIKRLLRSGDGYNPATAYRIVSMEEENFLLIHKNLELIDREYFSTGRQFFHVYRTQNRKTGDLVKFYTSLGGIVLSEIVNKSIENPYYKFTPKITDDY